MIDADNQYTQMQRKQYNDYGSPEKIVGNDIETVNNWPHWHYMFDGLSPSDKIGLDFGCGPGRNIKKWGHIFKRLDGTDISQSALNMIPNYLGDYNKPYRTWLCSGTDLVGIPDNSYDIIMSTICLQHIAVHEIRYNYFKEFYRVLKTDGWITLQMGFGHRVGAVGYYENKYDINGTNGQCDCMVSDPSELEKDLTEIGFRNFSHVITDVHPTDVHSNWIFFRARK